MRLGVGYIPLELVRFLATGMVFSPIFDLVYWILWNPWIVFLYITGEFFLLAIRPNKTEPE